MKTLVFSAIVVALVICGVVSATCPSNGISNTIFPFNPSGCPEMPRIPHEFSGCVYINDEPAPTGTLVSVSGTNVYSPRAYITTESNCFGGTGPFDVKLTAMGTPYPGFGMYNILEGSDLSFYVNGERARVCANGFCSWTTQFHSGHHTNLILTLDVPEQCCE